eukprot:1149102-Alexandrium_andersonii.AAC.1
MSAGLACRAGCVAQCPGSLRPGAATGALATGDRATRLRPELATGAPSEWTGCDRSLRPACDRTRRYKT